MENLNIQESNRLIAEFMGTLIRKPLGCGVKVLITDKGHPYFGDVGTFVVQMGDDISVNLRHSCRWVNDWGVEVVDYESTLSYDKDWNALMPVVEKIEGMENMIQFIIRGRSVDLQFWSGDDLKVVCYVDEPKLSMIYKAVIEFIKSYKLNQLKND